MPTRRRVLGAGAAVAVVALLAWVPQYFGSTDTQVFAKALSFSVAALGVNILTGYNGQISIGHGAFYGLGAYISAVLMENYGWQFLPTLPVVVVLLAVVGAAVGFPALRVKGLYLALITLGLATLFPDLVNKFVEGTGGTSLVQPPPVLAPSWAQGFAEFDDQYRYYMTLVISVVMFALAANLVRGRFGRALVAVRDHETAATTLGVNPASVKVSAFAISAVYAGIAGSLSVLITGLANAGKVEVFQDSIFFVVAVVIGGTATRVGPVVGAFVLILVQDRSQDLVTGKPVLSPAMFGIALIVFMFVLPDGIVGGLRRLGARRRHKGAAPV